MLVKQARDIARQWVMEHAGSIPGFDGAWVGGSTGCLAEDATLPATSDVDVMVVHAGAKPRPKLGKFLYRGALLEVSYMPREQLGSADEILADYHRAGFSTASVIVDPSGKLSELQATVSRDYAKRRWVRTRCEHARNRVLTYADSVNESQPFHDQVTSWLFATGVTTHVLLTAGLRNPTVRLRYVATRELLAEYDRLDFYEALLDLLGCAGMAPSRVEQHLAALADVFDATKRVVRTPFFFASDISDAARPIAIDGSRALIERGLHREAVFWIVATQSRCQKVLHDDAPALQGRFGPPYRELLADLGIASFADLRRRTEAIRERLFEVWGVAEAIVAANPAIED